MALHKTSECSIYIGPDVRRVDSICTPLLPIIRIAPRAYIEYSICVSVAAVDGGGCVFVAQIACSIPNGQSGTPLQLIH